jgi:hypothetical protein
VVAAAEALDQRALTGIQEGNGLQDALLRPEILHPLLFLSQKTGRGGKVFLRQRTQ